MNAQNNNATNILGNQTNKANPVINTTNNAGGGLFGNNNNTTTTPCI